MIENQNILEIKNHLLTLYATDTLSGTWIFTGMKGLGKASIALQIAGMILGKTEQDRLQVRNKVHPDLLYIERGLTDTERKEVAKILNTGGKLDPEEEAERKRNAEITVDDIRKINDFVHLSSVTGWKIIIVDPADEMNINAANAILKVIEEPPKHTVVILISHNERCLLPTILSRAKKVKFSAFSDDEIVTALKTNRPSIDLKHAFLISKLAGGSVGKAFLLLENNAAELFDELISLYERFPKVDVIKAYKLSDKLEKNEPYYETLKELYLNLLVAILQNKSGAGNFPLNLPTSLLNNLDKNKVLSLWEKTERLYLEATFKYLDKRQVLVNSLVELGLC